WSGGVHRTGAGEHVEGPRADRMSLVVVALDQTQPLFGTEIDNRVIEAERFGDELANQRRVIGPRSIRERIAEQSKSKVAVDERRIRWPASTVRAHVRVETVFIETCKCADDATGTHTWWHVRQSRAMRGEIEQRHLETARGLKVRGGNQLADWCIQLYAAV